MQTTLTFGKTSDARPLVLGFRTNTPTGPAPAKQAKKRKAPTDVPTAPATRPSSSSQTRPQVVTEEAPASVVWAAIRQQAVLGVSSIRSSHSLADRQAEEVAILSQAAGKRIGLPADGTQGSLPSHAGATEGWRRLSSGGASYMTASGKRLSGKAAFAAARRNAPRR